MRALQKSHRGAVVQREHAVVRQHANQLAAQEALQAASLRLIISAQHAS